MPDTTALTVDYCLKSVTQKYYQILNIFSTYAGTIVLQTMFSS